MRSALRVGARGSALSLWQARHAMAALRARDIATDLCVLSSTGDRDRESAIEDLPGDAPFADDLEAALRSGEIDVAVHSLKDLPRLAPADLTVAALLPRGSITESLVSHRGQPLAALPAGAVIGTSSSRRRAQILLLRPDLECRTIRGPVDARVEQVRAGAFDAAVLATAGLERLALEQAIVETFDPRVFVPAAGQGALALQARVSDFSTCGALAGLDHFATRLATTAEREAERSLEGAGQLAAVFATVQHLSVSVHARVLARDGSQAADGFSSGTEPARAAREAAERALDRLGALVR
jgi:hydroxymethylbilane synthase